MAIQTIDSGYCLVAHCKNETKLPEDIEQVLSQVAENVAGSRIYLLTWVQNDGCVDLFRIPRAASTQYPVLVTKFGDDLLQQLGVDGGTMADWEDLLKTTFLPLREENDPPVPGKPEIIPHTPIDKGDGRGGCIYWWEISSVTVEEFIRLMRNYLHVIN